MRLMCSRVEVQAAHVRSLTRCLACCRCTANGWPDELHFPSGTVHPASGVAASLVGLPGDYSWDVTTKGNVTVVTVPAVSLAKLPAASVASNAFVFKIRGVEISDNNA